MIIDKLQMNLKNKMGPGKKKIPSPSPFHRKQSFPEFQEIHFRGKKYSDLRLLVPGHGQEKGLFGKLHLLHFNKTLKHSHAPSPSLPTVSIRKNFPKYNPLDLLFRLFYYYKTLGKKDVKMALTKRTHINPCFWTALWNSDYFEKFLKSTPPEARNQKVIYLEINSDKKIIEKTKNVHFEKGLGLAEISPEGAKNYCKKYFPEEYDNFCKEMDKNPKHLTFDFENHFTAFEKLPPYQTLLNVIKKETIDSFEDKVNISLFLILHKLRSHCFIRPMTQLFQKIGDEKFALLLFLKQKISDHKFLLRLIWPIANAQWSLFKSDKHQYPLTDNPVTIKDGKVIAVLSPKLVLFVDLKKNRDAPIIYKRMSLFRYQQFKKRMISNTLKGIVFPNEKILKKWQKSRMWQKRRNFLKKNKSFISSIRKDDNWEIWIKNGSGLS